MKPTLSFTVLLATVGLASPLFAQTAAPKTDKEKLGYAFGMAVAQDFKKQPFEFDSSQFAAGFRDVMAGSKTQLTDEQREEILTNFTRDMQAKQGAAVSEKSKTAGAAFLAANKAKPGVQVLPDGLQYKVITEGTGPMPKATDTVTVKYRGTTIDGKEFDASDKHGGTASFPVGGVIKGWTEALQKMKVGAKWQLFIPSELAYGDRGAGADIPPGATLVFDVELVKIGE